MHCGRMRTSMMWESTMMAAGRPRMRVQLLFSYKRKVSGNAAQRFNPEYACIGASGS